MQKPKSLPIKKPILLFKTITFKYKIHTIRSFRKWIEASDENIYYQGMIHCNPLPNLDISAAPKQSRVI